jgi:hypothetical protein
MLQGCRVPTCIPMYVHSSPDRHAPTRSHNKPSTRFRKLFRRVGRRDCRLSIETSVSIKTEEQLNRSCQINRSMRPPGHRRTSISIVTTNKRLFYFSSLRPCVPILQSDTNAFSRSSMYPMYPSTMYPNARHLDSHQA